MLTYNFDESVRLEDDLYNYVNGAWIKKAKIPADQPSTGGFINLRNDVEKTMLKEFRNLAKKAPKDELLARAVLLYKKTMDEEERLKGKDYLLQKLDYFNNIKADNFIESLYYLYDNNFPLPFNFFVTEDMKDATKYALCLTGPSTILPDTTMYEGPSKDALLQAYRQMLATLLNKLGINDANTLIENTIAFDDKIRKIVKSSEEWADYIKTYNPYELNKVNEALGFELDYFLSARYGKKPNQIVVFDPRFLENYQALMQDSFNLYQAWAKVNLILQNVSYLSEEYRDLAGSYQRMLSGAKVMSSKEKFAYRLASTYFDEVIGVYYGKKYFGEAAKQDVITLVKNLVTSYKNRLTNNTWLSKATIEKAITKLDTMGIKIGYPDKITTLYYNLVFSANQTLIEVINTLNKINTRYNDDKLYQPVDKSVWVMSGSTVNACYNPSSNDITFPAAILQAPFYSINQEVEENYGGIGAVIGHEISHAFDNNGAQMDELGNINNWWTKEDYENFQTKTDLMIKQFDGLPLLDAKVNGKLSVSENIADNGGITSSLESLKRVKPTADLKLFFLNYARIWCMKARPEYTKLLLTVDVHGPSYYRANMQVRNFAEFHQAFNIKETDKMYLAPEKRIIIW